MVYHGGAGRGIAVDERNDLSENYTNGNRKI